MAPPDKSRAKPFAVDAIRAAARYIRNRNILFLLLVATSRIPMKMYVRGNWLTGEQRFEVRSPFSGEVVATVPQATVEDMDAAIAGAVEGAHAMRALGGYERSQILRRAADLLLARRPELAKTISLEEGKTLAEANFEVSRAAETLMLSAEEAKRLTGEVLPLEGAPGGMHKLGFTLRVSCGVVAAITPFNFPLNLVCHKVGPALAAGNAVVLKPASDTPLSALQLTAMLLEAGLPPLGLACLTGSGKMLGEALCRDARVRKITFTGSAEVGQQICSVAGLKRVTMELGSNSPIVVLPDADLNAVAAAIVSAGYGNAGQVCISAQRVIAVEQVHDALLSHLQPAVAALRCGDPLAAETIMGPMIRERDAQRVSNWIAEAVTQGAEVVCGGSHAGTLFEPTLVTNVTPEMKISREELFGPAVGITRAKSIEEAIAFANDSRYGLSASIFTRDLDYALRFAQRAESGNIHINGGPAWRADLMPYGGLKESGFGKEGPHYAVQEMTELKTVVIHGLSG
jgi:acyl-CoA reductase-like NAD-dependent aldehyde dehydrogenase